ncbi:hypothetical protein BIU89_04180 [Curtobacterium sp. MCBA15_005]|nr:hypothetical protein BIU89_04180 [Curtobacterium sp. MCBA15_005]
MHHFPSREALIRELGIASFAWFREAVAERVDLSENAPGKLLRAYVRAVCDLVADDRDPGTSLSLWLALSTEPSIAALLTDDIDYWDRELALDGLDAATITAVQMAADGINVMAVVAPDRARSRVATLRRTLLERTMTAEGGIGPVA